MVDEIYPYDGPEDEEDAKTDRAGVGVQNFDFSKKDRDTIIGELFLHLSPMEWKEELKAMNESIEEWNKDNSRLRPKKKFTEKEYLIGKFASYYCFLLILSSHAEPIVLCNACQEKRCSLGLHVSPKRGKHSS